MLEEARGMALREGNWKLIKPKWKNAKVELYDLSKDVGERNNVALKFPNRTGDMKSKLQSLIENKNGIRN